MVTQFILKKICGLFVVIALFLVCATVFVACEGEDPPAEDGVVCGVTFSTGVDEWEIETQAIEKGGKVTKPENFLREGYILTGWKCGDRIWNFSIDTVQESVELVAVWEEDTESWVYTAGLQFSYEQSVDSYAVSEYSGEAIEVDIPLYYNGNNGIKKVTAIKNNVFKDLPVTSLKMPTSISKIGEFAFSGTNIKRIEIPYSLTTIGDNAFNGMEELTTVVFNNTESPISIGSFAFGYCSALENIVIPDNVYELKAHSFAYSGLKSVLFGSRSSLSAVGEFAFASTNVVNVALPNSVVEIGEGAFSSCKSLKSVIIPSTLATVGDDIFLNCNKLKGIYYSDDLPDFASDISWTGLSSVLQFKYSKTDMGTSGYWHYSTQGLPVPHKKEKTVSLNLSCLSEMFVNGETYNTYTAVARTYYTTGNGLCNIENIVASIDDDGMATIDIDEYAYSLYRIEIYLSGAENYDTMTNILLVAANVETSRESVEFKNPNTSTCTLDVVN